MPVDPRPPTTPLNERGLRARFIPWSAPAPPVQQDRLRKCRLTHVARHHALTRTTRHQKSPSPAAARKPRAKASCTRVDGEVSYGIVRQPNLATPVNSTIALLGKPGNAATVVACAQRTNRMPTCATLRHTARAAMNDATKYTTARMPPRTTQRTKTNRAGQPARPNTANRSETAKHTARNTTTKGMKLLPPNAK